MKISPTVISSFARFMLGGKVFGHILAIVTNQETSVRKDGISKRTNAIKEFEAIGIEVASWLVNLGIELAVAYFKSLENRNK